MLIEFEREVGRMMSMAMGADPASVRVLATVRACARQLVHSGTPEQDAIAKALSEALQDPNCPCP